MRRNGTFRSMGGTAEKFAKQTERVSEAHECSAIEARRVKRMKENVLYVVLKVCII